MNDRIKGLVLSVNDYRENDLILQIISEDKSFLSLIAKGAKKIAAKRHFSALCIYEFIIDYKDNRTIYTVHNAKLLKSYYDDSDLQMLSYKNILCELCLKSRELYEPRMYENICLSLEELDRDRMYLIGSLFVSYLLKLYGIYPNVDECVVCGKEKVVGISKKLGGFLCLEHLGQEEAVGVDRLKKFRLINKADFDKLSYIRDVEYDLNDFSLIMDFFIENSDLNIRSYRLYRDLFLQ
ncbi:MAG: DNA repair protein RecO [Erysipelotrichaceae bacterium]|nr:DNA repair protein RecO [Erysipelotrichaceae bacterium]